MSYQDYFPLPGSQATVLLTSRNPEACGKYNTIGFRKLKELCAEDGAELLLRSANFPEDTWSSRRADARRIVKLLQSHTLALIHAGAYISETCCQLAVYLAEYRTQRREVLGFRSKRFGRDYGHVYATFNTSAHRLESTRGQDPKADDALYLLEILPMLHYTSFPAEIFKEAWQGYHNLGIELCDRVVYVGLQYI